MATPLVTQAAHYTHDLHPMRETRNKCVHCIQPFAAQWLWGDSVQDGGAGDGPYKYVLYHSMELSGRPVRFQIEAWET